MKTWLITMKICLRLTWLCTTANARAVFWGTGRENSQKHCCPFLIQPWEKCPGFFGTFPPGGEAGNESGNHSSAVAESYWGLFCWAWGEVGNCSVAGSTEPPASLFSSARRFGAGLVVGLGAPSRLSPWIFSHPMLCLRSARFCVSHAFSQRKRADCVVSASNIASYLF